MLQADVLIVGAGPAGAVAGLNLASAHRVLLVDRLAAPLQRIGESLPPAARRLLSDMGLWQQFLAEGHVACHGNRSRWGGLQAEQDFLRDPDGPGWHLNRARFEAWLQNKALERGAALLRATTYSALQRVDAGWRLVLHTPTGPCVAQARVLIDAGGRNARLSRALGARRLRQDKLICGWLYGADQGDHSDGLSDIESAEAGWWYSAALPDHRRVLAFHTDSDLPPARAMRNEHWLMQTALQLPGLGTRLRTSGFNADSTRVKLTAAHSATSTACAGPGWFAVGDAALGFDPLSAQGLFNALYTGLLAAEAVDRVLQGEAAAWAGYAEEIAQIALAYQQHLRFWYGQERRWANAPFWRRRMGGADERTDVRGSVMSVPPEA